MSMHDASEHTPARVSLADEEGVQHVLVHAILGLWEVVNNLTRVQPSRRDRYRVIIFGSARVQAGTVGYEETKRVAAALAAMGCDIIMGVALGSCRPPTRAPPRRRTVPRYALHLRCRACASGHVASAPLVLPVCPSCHQATLRCCWVWDMTLSAHPPYWSVGDEGQP